MIRIHESTSRFVHTTLQDYSTSFVRSSCVTFRGEIFNDKLTDLKERRIFPRACLTSLPSAGLNSHAHDSRANVFYSDPADRPPGLIQNNNIYAIHINKRIGFQCSKRVKTNLQRIFILDDHVAITIYNTN